MHMISKKDLSDAEMDTLTRSCSLTIVITANGEVQTHEEAIVYVKELEKFLTMKVLALRRKRVFLRMDQWSKTTSHEGRDSDNLQYGKLRSYRGSRLVKFFLCSFINTYETGESFVFFILTFFTYSRRNSGSRAGRCT